MTFTLKKHIFDPSIPALYRFHNTLRLNGMNYNIVSPLQELMENRRMSCESFQVCQSTLTINGELILSALFTGDRALYTSGISVYRPPINPARYKDSNLCVNSSSLAKSDMPQVEAPAEKTSDAAHMAARVVNPPAEPPRMTARFPSIRP